MNLNQTQITEVVSAFETIAEIFRNAAHTAHGDSQQELPLETPKTPDLTENDVRSAFGKALTRGVDQTVLMGLLTDHGAANVSQLEANQYAAVIEAVSNA